PELDPGNHLSYMLQWFAFGIMIIIAVGISARRERKAAAEAGPRSSGDSEYVVIDKAALDAEAKVSQPGSRYGRNRFSSPGVHGRAEAEEDAAFEERVRPRSPGRGRCRSTDPHHRRAEAAPDRERSPRPLPHRGSRARSLPHSGGSLRGSPHGRPDRGCSSARRAGAHSHSRPRGWPGPTASSP